MSHPDASGRINVRFPWLQGGEDTALWALPGVDDEVLVAFGSPTVRAC